VPTRLFRLSLLPVLVAVALGVIACGSSSSSTTSSKPSTSVVGKSTSVVVSPATTKLLKENEVTVSAVAPAKGSAVILLPTTSGHFVVSSATGRVEDTGGIKLSHAGTSVQFTGFVVDTESKQVTAAVGGLRAPVFDLTLGSLAHTTGPSGTAVFSGIKLTLTEEAATTLNSDLGVNNVFKAGQEFGVATQTIAVS
jgi:hypothetical protein